MKSSYWRRLILSVVSLGLVAVFACYLYINADKYMNLLQISLLFVILSMIFTAASLFISGIINIYLFQSLGAEPSTRDAFFLTAASTLANQLPIFGGIMTKGFYLKRKYSLSYTKFFSANLALFFCFIAVNGLIGIIILLYWILFENIVVSPLLLIGFGFMAACLLVFWLPVERIKMLYKIRTWLDQSLDGWRLIGKNPVLIGKLVALQTSLMLVLAIRYWIAFHMLSQDISVSEAVLFSSVSVLTQLVSIAPGGLGVTEAIVGGVALLLGFDMGVSVIAVGLDRLISIVIVFLLGGISTVALGRQISESQAGDA